MHDAREKLMGLIGGRARGAATLVFVSLIAACGGGGSGSSSNTVGTAAPPTITKVSPTASFLRSPVISTSVPLVVSFKDTSESGSSPITAWLWDFGDGGSSTQQNPVYTYTRASAFEVTLRVTTAEGSNTKTVSNAISITAPPVILPTTSFLRTPNSGTVPLVVKFSDTSDTGSGTNTAWLWDFGDGGSSSSQNPSHTYSIPGTYDVSLRVTTSAGNNTKVTTGSVVATAALPLRIIESLGASTTLPPLPEPATLGDQLSRESDKKYVEEALLPIFNPVVTAAKFTVWTGELGVNDCRDRAGINQYASFESLVVGTALLTSIPRRNTEDLASSITATGFHDPVKPTMPGNLMLMGVLDNPSFPAGNGKSYSLTGFPQRWESCEERTPFAQSFFTTYVVSGTQPITVLPVLRHYKKWRKINQIAIAGDGSESMAMSWAAGISDTKAKEVTLSISATVGASGGGFSAELTASLAQTLSQSQTVTKEETLQLSTLADSSLKPGYSLLYSAWVIVDVYQIEGATRGVLWSDPNYTLASDQLVFEVPTRTDLAYQSAWFLRQ